MSVARLSGMGAWLVQRLSALYMLLFLCVVALGALRAEQGFAAWRAFWTQPVVALLTALFVVAVLFHGWVGIRDVILDYVRPVWLRLFALVLVAGSLLALGLWAAWLLIRVVQL